MAASTALDPTCRLCREFRPPDPKQPRSNADALYVGKKIHLHWEPDYLVSLPAQSQACSFCRFIRDVLNRLDGQLGGGVCPWPGKLFVEARPEKKKSGPKSDMWDRWDRIDDISDDERERISLHFNTTTNPSPGMELFRSRRYSPHFELYPVLDGPAAFVYNMEAPKLGDRYDRLQFKFGNRRYVLVYQQGA